MATNSALSRPKSASVFIPKSRPRQKATNKGIPVPVEDEYAPLSSTQEEWRTWFFSRFDDDSGSIKAFVETMLSKVVNRQSEVSMEDYIPSDRLVEYNNWPSYGAIEDATFEEVVVALSQHCSEEEIAKLVKPSGSYDANLHVPWAYPSNGMVRPFYGETADPTNPCTRTGMRKLGMLSKDTEGRLLIHHDVIKSVLMSDIFCGRLDRLSTSDSAPWERLDPKIQEIHAQ